MNFERLFLLRQSNGLTQDEMGKILGVKRVAVSQWENTKEIIPLDKLNIYSNYFEVSLDYLTGLNDNKRSVRRSDLNKNIIGKNLRLLRKDLNLTQKDLANILNTSHSTISAYESGKTMLLTAFALQICVKYSVSLDWICGKSKKMNIKQKSFI